VGESGQLLARYANRFVARVKGNPWVGRRRSAPGRRYGRTLKKPLAHFSSALY
jgi:hypothetical protein